jgi:16S rRNA (cytidine1402-2'-O)-methyltransferase
LSTDPPRSPATRPGTLYLIPTPLGDLPPETALAPPAIEAARRLELFIVENEKSAWRFLARLKDREGLARVRLSVLDEHSLDAEIPGLLLPILEGADSGLSPRRDVPASPTPARPW